MTDKLPPNSFEAEQAVLGCLLIDCNAVMPNVAEILGAEPEIFYDLRHQWIYDSIVDLYARSIPVNSVTVLQSVIDRGIADKVGGPAYLSALPDAAPTTLEAEYFATIVADKFSLRRLIVECTEIIKRTHEGLGDTETLISDAEKAIMGIRRQRPESSAPMSELVADAIIEIQRIYETQGAVSGIPTGFCDLDRMTDGLHPSEMIVLAGFPGSGKTGLAMNIAEHVAIDRNWPVGVFSLEMSAKRLVFRILASRSRLNLRKLKKGEINEETFKQMTIRGLELKRSNFHFCELTDLSIFQLRAKARQMVQKHGIKLFVVDYLQLLSAPGTKNQSREQEVSTISRGIKLMACELGVPVVVLSQLNDDGKLRESRAIGQDADAVWKLRYKEEPKPKDGNEKPVTEICPMILDIVKQRDGESPVSIDLTFFKSFVRYESAAKIDPNDIP